MTTIENVNMIVAVGSVDGILTTAALLRLIGADPEMVGITFTQAFTVDKIDVSGWKPGRTVAFVDLAVNNRDKSMTAGLVSRIRDAGHEIVAVCDEHSREDWLEILGSFEELLIEPQSQATGLLKSSGAVLLAVKGVSMDEQTKILCVAADQADQMNFVGVGEIVNRAVKSKIHDDGRRVYMAWHFARSMEADAAIDRWVAEYDSIMATHQQILAAKVDLGGGIIRVSAVGKVVDMTTLMSQLYEAGAMVVVLEGEMYDKATGGKVRQVSFGTKGKLDLLTCIKPVVPMASGFTSKVNVPLESEQVALTAVQEMLTRQ